MKYLSNHTILSTLLLGSLSICASLVNAQVTPAPKEAAKETVTWKELWDGKTMDNWKKTGFSGSGEVRVETKFKNEGPVILVKAGSALSGLNYTKEIPKNNYEISLEAIKVEGYDFLCGLTFPVDNSFASLICGGWGGAVLGISSIDTRDASENDTTQFFEFKKDKWYKIRLRVTPERLTAWIDEKKLIDQEIKGHKISLRPGEISLSVPLGLCTYQTTGAFRNIKIRNLEDKK